MISLLTASTSPLWHGDEKSPFLREPDWKEMGPANHWARSRAQSKAVPQHVPLGLSTSSVPPWGLGPPLRDSGVASGLTLPEDRPLTEFSVGEQLTQCPHWDLQVDSRTPYTPTLVSAQSCCSPRAVGWALCAEARGTQLLWYAAFLPLTKPCWQAESRAPQGSAMPEPDSEAAVGLTGEGPTHLPPSRSSSGELLSPDLWVSDEIAAAAATSGAKCLSREQHHPPPGLP